MQDSVYLRKIHPSFQVDLELRLWLTFRFLFNLFSFKFDLLSLANFFWKLYEIEEIFILSVANNVSFLAFFPEPPEEIKLHVKI